MPNPERISALIRTRWAFAIGVFLGAGAIHWTGPAVSIGFALGVLAMGIVATVTDGRRGRG